MTDEPPPPAAEAGHLTAALRRAGVLGGGGSVSGVAVESSRDTVLSRIRRLRLSYRGASDAPETVILKTGLPGRADGAVGVGRREVEFYTRVADATPARLVPRCFGADWNDDTKAWHILLEDLGETHRVATEWPLPPTMAECEGIVRARARFHAAWWDDPRLGASVGARPKAEDADREARRFAGQFKTFAGRMGDCLPRENFELVERLVEAAPRLLARASARGDLTIVHGDAHVWNCFLPREPGSDDARLFDWDGWHVGAASDDLAYMMAVHWYPDLRRERERPLLDRYHAALVAHGVSGYGRDALDADYRLSVLWQVATPVWQAVHGIPPWIWWNNLGRVLLAVDDLGCRDLLA